MAYNVSQHRVAYIVSVKQFQELSTNRLLKWRHRDTSKRWKLCTLPHSLTFQKFKAVFLRNFGMLEIKVLPFALLSFRGIIKLRSVLLGLLMHLLNCLWYRTEHCCLGKI